MTKEIEHAERDLNNLEEQRNAIASRAALLDRQRKSIAFAALTAGDKKAKDRLAEINSEAAGLAFNIASVEDALTVARANLVQAQQAAAGAALKANAIGLRAELAKFRELGEFLDECFADINQAGAEQKKVLDNIHAFGQAAPTAQQYRVLCEIALKTAVAQTPFWSHDFPAMSPTQRKSFKSIVDAWCDPIEANIAAVLGDEKEKDAA